MFPCPACNAVVGDQRENCGHSSAGLRYVRFSAGRFALIRVESNKPVHLAFVDEVAHPLEGDDVEKMFVHILDTATILVVLES